MGSAEGSKTFSVFAEVKYCNALWSYIQLLKSQIFSETMLKVSRLDFWYGPGSLSHEISLASGVHNTYHTISEYNNNHLA